MDPIEIVINGTDKGFLKTLQTAVRAENEMKDGLEKIKKKSEEAAGSLDKMGKSGDKSFGSQALGLLSTFTGGMDSLGGAVALVTNAINQLNVDATAAISTLSKLTEQRKEMAQLAKDPKDYYRLKTSAQEVSTTYGLDQEKAHSITNAARAGGFEGSLQQVALAAATFANADDLTSTAAILPTLFPGLSPEQSINLAAAGGTEAKSMTFKGISNEMRIAAQGTAVAGSSAVETAALTTVLSDPFFMSTGDRLRSFGTKASLNKDLAGKGVMGAFEALQAMPEDKRRAFLKDDLETNQVYNELVKRGGDVRAMEKLLGDRMLATGTANSPLATGAQSFLQDRENRAQFNANVAAQRAELSNQQRNGVWGLGKQQRYNEGMVKFGHDSPIARALVEAEYWVPGMAATPTDYAGKIEQGLKPPPMIEQPAVQGAAEKLDQAATKLLQGAGQLQTSRHNAANREAIGNQE